MNTSLCAWLRGDHGSFVLSCRTEAEFGTAQGHVCRASHIPQSSRDPPGHSHLLICTGLGTPVSTALRTDDSHGVCSVTPTWVLLEWADASFPLQLSVPVFLKTCAEYQSIGRGRLGSDLVPPPSRRSTENKLPSNLSHSSKLGFEPQVSQLPSPCYFHYAISAREGRLVS